MSWLMRYIHLSHKTEMISTESYQFTETDPVPYNSSAVQDCGPGN